MLMSLKNNLSMDPQAEFSFSDREWDFESSTPAVIVKVRTVLLIFGILLLAAIGVAIAYASITKKYTKNARSYCAKTSCAFQNETEKADKAALVVIILVSVSFAVAILLLMIAGAISLSRQ